MKFTAVLAFIAAATVVSASTNAERLARGLPPRAPGKRATPAHRARHSSPSGTPWGGCNTGEMHCCNSVQKAHSGNTCDDAMKKLGILGDVEPGTDVGVGCSPITAVGATGGSHCSQQTVCCDHNNWQGIVNVGCTPVNIGL